MKSFLPFFDAMGPNIQEEQTLQLALNFLIRISSVKSEDDEVFKTVLDFWQYFAKELYQAETSAVAVGGRSGVFGSAGGAAGGYTAVPLVPPLGQEKQRNHGSDGSGAPIFPVQQRYTNILSQLSHYDDHMAKPEEVIVVENDEGEIVREMTKDTVIAQYKAIQRPLCF